MFSKKRLIAALASAVVSCSAWGQSPSEPSTTEIIQLLIDKGVVTRQEANQILRDARRTNKEDEAPVRVPYIPEALRQEIREEVKKEVVETAEKERWGTPDAYPAWLNRFEFYGDVRLRGQGDIYPDDNLQIPDAQDINEASDGQADGFEVPDALPILDNQEDRYRLRVRARLGVNARITDTIDAGVRLVTGDEDDPVSANQTLGDMFDKFSLTLDRAFIRFRPSDGLALYGGKFANPFYATPLIYDSDLQFEGAAIRTSHPLGSNSDKAVFVNAGVFALEESVVDSDDKWLYGAQTGFDWGINGRLGFRLAAAYYYYDNVQGQVNSTGTRDNDDTAPAFVQWGNTLFNIRDDGTTPNTLRYGLASEFEVLALTSRLDFRVRPGLKLHVLAEFARNLAYDESAYGFVGMPGPGDNQDSTGDTAWLVEAGIGSDAIRERYDWSLATSYRKLESDSVLDAFNDSDFGNGGTNKEGFVIEGALGVARNVWLKAAWLSARSLDLDNVPNGGQNDVDTIQLDLNTRF